MKKICKQYLTIFLDALASLDFKLSVSQQFISFGFKVNQVKRVIQEIQLIQVMQVMQDNQDYQYIQDIQDNQDNLERLAHPWVDFRVI